MSRNIVIDHNHAVAVENIVTGTLRCKYGAYGGIVTADNFARNPFDAAMMCMTFLGAADMDGESKDAVDDFYIAWTIPGDEMSQDDFVNDLSQLVSILRNRT